MNPHVNVCTTVQAFSLLAKCTRQLSLRQTDLAIRVHPNLDIAGEFIERITSPALAAALQTRQRTSVSARDVGVTFRQRYPIWDAPNFHPPGMRPCKLSITSFRLTCISVLE